MKQGQSLKFMDFTLNASKSMETQRYGSYLLMCLTTFLSERWLTTKCLQSMEGSRLRFIMLMMSSISGGCKKSPTKAHLLT